MLPNLPVATCGIGRLSHGQTAYEPANPGEEVANYEVSFDWRFQLPNTLLEQEGLQLAETSFREHMFDHVSQVSPHHPPMSSVELQTLRVPDSHWPCRISWTIPAKAVGSITFWEVKGSLFFVGFNPTEPCLTKPGGFPYQAAPHTEVRRIEHQQRGGVHRVDVTIVQQRLIACPSTAETSTLEYFW